MSGDRPLYARLLRLRHLRPSGVLCFLLFEGSVALAILLALAELTTWWAVLVLPVTVAAMVKINDSVAGAVARSGSQAPVTKPAPAAEPPKRDPAPPGIPGQPVVGRASVPGAVRQSGSRS